MESAHHRAKTKATTVPSTALLVAACLVGCSSLGEHKHEPTASVTERSAFYWQYAPLAANVYDTKGIVDDQISLALASPWLRREVRDSGDTDVRFRYEYFTEHGRSALDQDGRIRQKCGETAAATLAGPDNAVRSAEERCKTTQDVEAEVEQESLRKKRQPNSFDMAEPTSAEDCKFRDGRPPAVPLRAAMKAFGWEQVPELHKPSTARGWSIFVPDLAIDVWRRPREPVGAARTVEYAIVYRGTVGSGGIVSNFRALTSVTSFIWDQYSQARQATEGIINQIYQLHGLSDRLFGRDVKTRILVTAVGHSLGAGLASYVFYKVPQITRVVGFDPTPFDGSALISLDQRPSVMESKRNVDHDPRDPAAAIFLLYEKGEAISQVAHCYSGPIWGLEGGPNVRCETVNFSDGSWLRQHSMSQLACNLYLNSQAVLPQGAQ